MQWRTLVCLAALGVTLTAQAVPTVTGNTISWPDDGWYQVEDSLTGIIVCQGGRECTVPNGIYWVTLYRPDGSGSGWRVELISNEVAQNDRALFENTITVDDRTINWSLGGWYQVQDANTYVEVCNGRSSCTVGSAGQYLVINHSLGLRTIVDIVDRQNDAPIVPVSDGISTLDTDQGSVGAGHFMINNNTITWLDGAWYQVQRSTDLQTVCEGGTFCEVESGNYIVINHTTGLRWEDVSVPVQATIPATNSPGLSNGMNTDGITGDGEISDGATGDGSINSAVTINGNTISWTDTGWYQVQNQSDFSTVCEGGTQCTVENGTYIVINHTTGERSEVIVNN